MYLLPVSLNLEACPAVLFHFQKSKQPYKFRQVVYYLNLQVVLSRL